MIPALGRPFALGMLYDRRSDQLIPGKTLWSPDHLKASCNTVPVPFTNSEVFTENGFEDKASAFHLHASQKISVLSGLVHVEGAAKFLIDTKTSKRQSRVVLKYETTTEVKQLTMEHLVKEPIQNPDDYDNDIATDVVVGILYGAKAFLVFENEVSKDESMEKVHENTEVLVKSLSNIFVDGREFNEINEEQNDIKNIHCKMYGDFPIIKSPTHYEDAVEVYKKLPSLIGKNGENAVPIQVYLRPLSDIDIRWQRMVREISDDVIRKTVEIQEYLQSVVAECKDMTREEICVLFPRVGKIVTRFMKNVKLYMILFQKKIMSLLPLVQGAAAEETELAYILEMHGSSPFSRNVVERWLEDKKREMKRLHGIISSLGETPVVSPEVLESELFKPTNEYIVCCTLKLAQEDEQLPKMDAHLSNSEVKNNTSSTNEAHEKEANKKVRETLRHFAALKSVNEDSNSVKFLATDEPLSPDFHGNSGAFLYLYEDGEIDNEDLISYPKPHKLQVKEKGETTLELWWEKLSGNNVKGYKVQYRDVKDEANTGAWSSVEVESNGEAQQRVTITGLQPATKYVIRVCAVRKIIVSEYSEVFSATTKPTSPPEKPQLYKATPDALTIHFTKPKNVGEEVQINSYKVEWSSDGNWTAENVKYTADATPTFTLEDLQPRTSHVFKVTANCGKDGESNPSPSSDAFSTSVSYPKLQLNKILGSCKLIEPPEVDKPAVYALPLTPVHDNRAERLRKYEIRLEGQNSTRDSDVPNKVIMMVGETGSGKTTTVNAMINHILGVDWEDPFRLKMIHEDSFNQGTHNIGNQTRSQTQYVTCYTLPHMKGFKLPYTLTIVDTPGFGDTRGIKQDEMITEQIRTFFNTNGVKGIDHIDAICFLAQAGLPRLTPTQSYVFDRILSMFGKDIQKNISILFTFADGQPPQALGSLREIGILDEEGKYFKFNNSALFVDNSGENNYENFSRCFWEMGIKSFEKFFKSLGEMETKSLVLTKEVLHEREQLEVSLSGLRQKINCGINALGRLQQEHRIFNQHAADINANTNFKYTVQEEKRVQVPLGTGTYTTNCTTCNYTCHFPCRIPRSEDKARCAAMTNEQCRECPNKCHWSLHVNDQYRMDTELVEVEKEYDSKKTLYTKAVEGKSKIEALIDQLQAEFDETSKCVLTFVAEMQRGLQRLSEIALKKDPLQQVDYLDLLIQSEKSQAKPGFLERVQSLQETRNRAAEINKMVKPEYDPWKEYRENEDTQKFLQRDNNRHKKGIVRRIYDHLTK